MSGWTSEQFAASGLQDESYRPGKTAKSNLAPMTRSDAQATTGKGDTPRVDSAPVSGRLTANAERVGKSPKHSSEHREQVAFIKWAERNRHKYPELGAIYAIPNGAAKSSTAQGKRMKNEGQKTGVPDLCLPCSAGEFSALYIEMKYMYKKPRESQVAWINFLRALGNRVEVCYSYDAARLVTCDYLGIDPEKAL